MGAASSSQSYPKYPNRPDSQPHDEKFQKQNNKLIEKELKLQKQQMVSAQKLLLLGPGESGKSTILKQMRILHAEGFSEKELEIQKNFIRSNMVQSIMAIIKAMEKFEVLFSDEQLQSIQTVQNCIKDEKVDEPNLSAEVVEAIKHLWADQEIQNTYEKRSEYQLVDSAKYFLDSVDRIYSEDYTPTQDDVIRCRVKTTGVVETKFTISDVPFSVVDVGGQRSERRKWIQCFDSVNTILFIASLSEYDQTLEEDNSTNRMKESLLLFSWICSHKIFLKTPIILFLNKTDLFEEKIKHVPITVAFPEYNGAHTSRDSLDYIIKMYDEANSNPDRRLYIHETCATDTEQISYILDDTIKTVIQKNVNLIL